MAISRRSLLLIVAMAPMVWLPGRAATLGSGSHVYDPDWGKLPNGVTDQVNGELPIPDLWGRVTIFDKHNRPIAHLGDNPDVRKSEGWPNIPHEMRVTGKFVSPHAACWDAKGNIYVAEWIADGRVTKLRRV